MTIIETIITTIYIAILITSVIYNLNTMHFF